MIPVVDIFAGPGGLAEGFSSILDEGRRVFDVRLSIEMDAEPFRTLRMRSFFRRFEPGCVPDDYYRFLRGDIAEACLFEAWPDKASEAEEVTWQTTLGKCDHSIVDSRIKKAVDGARDWLLIGGPPCQAYSRAGIVGNRTNADYNPEKDDRYSLYKEYIRILAVHKPSAFVLENVPGMLEARLNGSLIIDDLIGGLIAPADFCFREFGSWPEGPRYRLLSITSGIQGIGCDPRSFIVRMEDFGIPQSRHRVIIIGIRADMDPVGFSPPGPSQRTVLDSVINDLPRIRSGLSKESDSRSSWRDVFRKLADEPWLMEVQHMHGRKLKKRIMEVARQIVSSSPDDTGAAFIQCAAAPRWNSDWYVDERVEGVCHHTSRPHMRSDLHRYLFSACFAENAKRSPKLPDFPPSLLPEHRNASSGDFRDRFRVLIKDMPSWTVLSHLAKDGHSFIHPDPVQCRSISPREAARIQTFPDNYFFFGGRTAIFRQIGNAVPPWLARLVAGALVEVIKKQ